MVQREDLTGKKFGHLTILRLASEHDRGRNRDRRCWHCKCDCGAEVVRSTYHLSRSKNPRCSVNCSAAAKKRYEGIIGNWEVVENQQPLALEIWVMCRICANVQKVFKTHLVGRRRRYTVKCNECGSKQSTKGIQHEQ